MRIHLKWLIVSVIFVALLVFTICQCIYCDECFIVLMFKWMYDKFTLEFLTLIATSVTACAAVVAVSYSSFDSLFSQLVSSQRGMFSKPSLRLSYSVPIVMHIPYRGRSALYMSGTVYDGFESYLKIQPKVPQGTSGVSQLWKDYNGMIGSSYPDFANSFKYIYHEVSTIQGRCFMCSRRKREYVKIVQAQMNLNELLCYLFNLIEYDTRHPDNKYSLLLKEYDFFSDLYDNVKYKAILEDHIQIAVLSKYLNEYSKK